jgi:hypothetical protein
MKSLRRTLLENVGPAGLPKDALGSDEMLETAIATGPPINPEKLKRDLTSVKKDNTKFFVLCVIMVFLLFLVSVGVVLTNLSKPDVVKLVMATFGVSCAGLITMMIRLWREKSNTELVLALAINMNDMDTLKTVLAVLIRKL